MKLFTETYAFTNDDLDIVSEKLSKVLGIKGEKRFNESYGGDFFAFWKAEGRDGHILLYANHSADIDGPIIQEEDFPNFGLILLIEQRDFYIDYGPKIKKLEALGPQLLYRSQYDDETKEKNISFNLAKDQSKAK